MFKSDLHVGDVIKWEVEGHRRVTHLITEIKEVRGDAGERKRFKVEIFVVEDMQKSFWWIYYYSDNEKPSLEWSSGSIFPGLGYSHFSIEKCGLTR